MKAYHLFPKNFTILFSSQICNQIWDQGGNFFQNFHNSKKCSQLKTLFCQNQFLVFSKKRLSHSFGSVIFIKPFTKNDVFGDILNFVPENSERL